MPKDIYTVYKITNTINDKVYIGITSRLHKRWWGHKKNAINKLNRPLYNAMAKYGIDQFTITPICSTLTREDLGIIEQQLIKEHNSIVPNGYNLTTGGEMAYTVSEQTKEKQRQNNLGKTMAEETKAKISRTNALVMKGNTNGKGNKGRVFSKETLQKMSDARKGKPSPRKGVILSKETRQKMSIAAKNRTR